VNNIHLIKSTPMGFFYKHGRFPFRPEKEKKKKKNLAFQQKVKLSRERNYLPLPVHNLFYPLASLSSSSIPSN
jgi:hypothetical protein